MNDKIFAILDRSLTNIGQSVLDSYIEVNAAFRFKSGIKTVIVRRQLGNCCDWCDSLAGIYDYSDAPADVYKRHDNCRCMVTFKNEKGKYVDVWSRDVHVSQREARKSRSIKLQSEIERNDKRLKKERIAIAQGEKYIDTTDIWLKNKIEGGGVFDRDFAKVGHMKYKVNGKTIILDYSKDEMVTAQLLQNAFGGVVEMLPKVNWPRGVKTPDYVINGVKFDRKGPTGGGKNTIFNNLKSIKGQADNIVLDITECKLSEEVCISEIKRCYGSKHLQFLETVILVKDNKIIRVFERIRKK